MRVKVKLGRVTTRINYNKYIQAIIYNCLDDKELHDRGYVYKNCSYKPFVYSRLRGRYRLMGDIICFWDGAVLDIGISDELLAKRLVNNMIKTKDERHVGGCKFNIERIDTIPGVKFGNKARFKTLSPVTIHTRGKGKGGRFWYIRPDRKEHGELLAKNLVCKHRAIFGTKYDVRDIKIEPVGGYKKEVVKSEGEYVESYITEYVLKGEPELIRTAYDCGLGLKNAQGFGCLEIVDGL